MSVTFVLLIITYNLPTLRHAQQLVLQTIMGKFPIQNANFVIIAILISLSINAENA